MELNFLVASADEMVDDVRGRGVAAGATEPFLADKTLDDAGGIVDAAIASG